MDCFDRYRSITDAWFDRQVELPSEVSRTFKPRADDVIIAGHVKSGTTWMQQILHQIRTNGDENFGDIYDVVPYFPNLYDNSHVDLDQDQTAKPRLFKTHDTYENIVQWDEIIRFVVTVRHPYDSEYSLMKFLWKFYGMDQEVSPEEYVQVVNYRRQKGIPDFADFISSWWPRRHQSNILFVPYEDMKRDTPSAIQKINKFVFGHSLEEPTFSKILHLCSFEFMSQHRQQFTAREMLKSRATNAGLAFLPGASLVRSDGGQVGQGKMKLPNLVRQYVDKRWEETVQKEHGLESYEDMYQKWCAENVESRG